MSLPDYLQDTAKDFAKQLTASTSVPIKTSTFTGRQFVAGEDPLQTQAINLARQGVGSFQPFLQAAQTAVGAQAGLTGPTAFRQFMSPFQQDVIDTTLADFDRQAALGRQNIRDRAATAGAFGGGRVPMQEGGIMDLGGLEKDYRTGGFVELGAEERADDVPARLSKNEFVFTADAVRAAGGGDIDKGAEVMQNMMDNLEAGGTISEESQGMNPAQEMFDQTQMMESRLA